MAEAGLDGVEAIKPARRAVPGDVASSGRAMLRIRRYAKISRFARRRNKSPIAALKKMKKLCITSPKAKAA